MPQKSKLNAEEKVEIRGMNQIEPKRTFINPNLSIKL